MLTPSTLGDIGRASFDCLDQCDVFRKRVCRTTRYGKRGRAEAPDRIVELSRELQQHAIVCGLAQRLVELDVQLGHHAKVLTRACFAEPVIQPQVSGPDAASTSLVVVASGKGSPGCSTLAVNLAAGIGAVESAVVVDLDLAGPSVAALLGLNPRLNVYMLAHAEPQSSRDWSKALDQELQPLAARSPHGAALAGIPKPEMRSAITLSFLQRLLPELQQRFSHVVLDIGTIQGPWGEWAWQGWVVGAAGQVLFVTAASPAGINQSRMALARIPELRREQVGLVVGRYDRRKQHNRAEIEFNVGRPVAAFIPYDHRALEQATWAQQPVIFTRRSRAGRTLLEFAERVHGGRILLPPETATPKRRRLRRPSLPGHFPKPGLGWLPLRAAAPLPAPAPIHATEVGDVDAAPAV